MQTLFKTSLFLLLGCVLITGPLHAQEKLLDRSVKLHVTNMQLKKVLDRLSKDNNISFSYSTNIIDQDRVMTITIPESTLRLALQRILGNGYDLDEMDDYVIIRRKGMGKREAAKARRMGIRSEIRSKESEWQKEDGRDWNGKVPPVEKAKKYDLREDPSPEYIATKATVRNIIDDMVQYRIVTDKDHFAWFGLDNGQFVVDGHPVADSLHTIFRQKYVGPDGMGYYFGPVSVHGRGYFFDRSDIYGTRVAGDPTQPKSPGPNPKMPAQEPKMPAQEPRTQPSDF